jgi:arginyl-tRNA synthetase
MVKDNYKRLFASRVARAFRTCYPEIHSLVGVTQVFDDDVILRGIEEPKDSRLGWFAFPVFRHLGLLKEKPAEVAAKVSQAANNVAEDDNRREVRLHCTAAGGYINAQISGHELAAAVVPEIISQGEAYGASTVCVGKTCLVEYSSPNIAKPFGVGHLRSTVIGNSLRRIFKKLGYDVVGINYPGDWGTQFGKMIVAYRKWGEGSTDGDADVRQLLGLYVRFHDEAEKDDSLNEEARRAFKLLEDGDPQSVELWEQFKKTSHAEFDRIYGILGVEFDLVYGESFLNDKMEATIKRLDKAGLTQISQGALVVDLHDSTLPPALLRKADGATLYLTRDLTGAYYRWDRYHFDQSLYVVGTSQSDHFKQMLKVMALLEDAEQTPADERVSTRIRHVDFGWVKFGDKTMSTRRGNIIFLEDVIDKAVELAGRKIREKNPDLKNLDETARLIGVGAVIFSQLSVRRNKDVNFVWEDVLNFEGETGPYLQYTHARLCSLLRHYAQEVTAQVDYGRLRGEEEQRVVELLADFPDAVASAAAAYDPHVISAYLLRLSGAFNKFYQRKDDRGRIDKIISDDASLTAARMVLVKTVQVVVREGLYLLGLEAPEEM